MDSEPTTKIARGLFLGENVEKLHEIAKWYAVEGHVVFTRATLLDMLSNLIEENLKLAGIAPLSEQRAEQRAAASSSVVVPLSSNAPAPTPPVSPMLLDLRHLSSDQLVERTVKQDHLVCLECGAQKKALKRHLSSKHGMTPIDYIKKHNLPADYPMVCPDYREVRKGIAERGNERTRRKAQAASPAPGRRSSPAGTKPKG